MLVVRTRVTTTTPLRQARGDPTLVLPPFEAARACARILPQKTIINLAQSVCTANANASKCATQATQSRIYI